MLLSTPEKVQTYQMQFRLNFDTITLFETLQMIPVLFFATLALLVAGGLVPLLAPRQRSLANASHAMVFVAGIALATFSILTLTQAPGASIPLIVELPFGFSPFDAPRFLVDALSAYFCLILAILASTISLYSVRYSRYYAEHPPGTLAGFFSFIILSMLVVFTSDNIFQFLVSWETMTLFAFFLVLYEYRKDQSIRAATYYAVMTHFGMLFLLAMFLVIQHYAGTANLSGITATIAKFPRGTLNFIFIAALIGFGTKAGVFPFHIWLPLAHPVAPTNVSALMSGMMIKAGIYGLLRVLLVFNDAIEPWWGIVLLVIASSSALLGVLYALMEHELKRLLAYHSIENIGIILIGVAMSMLFWHFKMPALAGFALTAGLFHTLNHAIFKSLLFLGAGGIHYKLHSRDMEKMGGLIRLMPWTATLFLIGALSISAVPPFNGFVSEWMTFISIIQVYNIDKAPEVIRIVIPIAGAMLALTGALAAACFVKVFGIIFLGTPRSEMATRADEVPTSMWFSQLILAALCVVLGVFPVLVIKLTGGIRAAFFGAAALSPGHANAMMLAIPDGTSSISTFYVSASLIFFTFFSLAIARVFKKSRKTTDITWACGGTVGGRQQYTATGFSKPIRMIFSPLYQPKKQIVIDTGENRYHVKAVRYHGEIQNIFENYLYLPMIRFTKRISLRLLLLQETSINAYLGYILVLFIFLLLVGSRL